VTAEEHRPLMLSIAYRMVGSFSEAEDLVQDAYERLAREDGVQNPKAWLSTVVTRLCIDHLRSARVRREEYPGTWLPEPVAADPAPDAAVRSETLSIAVLVLLESLSPVERAVFVLREAFDYPFDEIAEIVGKSPDNCRQLVVRARRRVEERRPRFEPSREQREELMKRFVAALHEGETEPLVEMLAADAAFYGDGGGKAPAIARPVHGGLHVAKLLLAFRSIAVARAYSFRAAEINGGPGLVGFDADGTMIAAMSFNVSDGRIRTILSVVNPEKLAHISSTILPSLPPA
jgi:RNA polymerase sigma-70 factor (TIGR02957 family)